MCELESGLMCKTRDVITQTPVRWVRTRAIVFELGSWCWDPRLRCYIGPLVLPRRTSATDKNKHERVSEPPGRSNVPSGVPAVAKVIPKEAPDRPPMRGYRCQLAATFFLMSRSDTC